MGGRVACEAGALNRHAPLYSGVAPSQSQKPRAFAAGVFVAAVGVATGTTYAEPMCGLLVFGHEARTLQPCGDDKTFWVDAQGPLRKRLEKEYRAVATGPYEAVYVEIEGEILDRPAGAFAADYNGTVGVTELHSISRADADVCRSGQPVGAQRPPATSEAETYVFVCDQQTVFTVQTTETEA